MWFGQLEAPRLHASSRFYNVLHLSWMTRLVSTTRRVTSSPDASMRDMCQAILVNAKLLQELRSLYNREYCIIAFCGAILRRQFRRLSVMSFATSFHFDNPARICNKE